MSTFKLHKSPNFEGLKRATIYQQRHSQAELPKFIIIRRLCKVEVTHKDKVSHPANSS